MDEQRMTGEDARRRDRIEELEREVERLEAANRELRRTNARLASGRVAKLDSAAASALQRERPGNAGFGRRLRGRLRTRMRALALRILR
jgi:predicted RNase H-like nuclease (RuvC/YqgF family)